MLASRLQFCTLGLRWRGSAGGRRASRPFEHLATQKDAINWGSEREAVRGSRSMGRPSCQQFVSEYMLELSWISGFEANIGKSSSAPKPRKNKEQDGTHAPECKHVLENKRPNIFWHSCRRHSCRALFWDTLVRHFGHCVGHSCRTLLWDTLADSCATLLWDTGTLTNGTHVLRCNLATSEATAPRSCLPHYMCTMRPQLLPVCYQVACPEATAPRSCLPHYMCTMRPQLLPVYYQVACPEATATRSCFPHYICATSCHFWATLLSDILVRHSCGTLLWDTLVTLVGHSCMTPTLVGNSCGTLLWDTFAKHSCRTLLWDGALLCWTLL